jgi:hypothetical protein
MEWITKHPYTSTAVGVGFVTWKLCKWLYKKDTPNTTFTGDKYCATVAARRFDLSRKLMVCHEYTFKRFLFDNIPQNVLCWGDDTAELSTQEKVDVFNLLLLDLPSCAHHRIKSQILRKIFSHSSDEEWDKFVYTLNVLPISTLAMGIWKIQPASDFDLDDICFWAPVNITESDLQAYTKNLTHFQNQWVLDDFVPSVMEKFMHDQKANPLEVLGPYQENVKLDETEESLLIRFLFSLQAKTCKGSVCARGSASALCYPKRLLNTKCSIYVIRFILNKLYPKRDRASLYKLCLFQAQTTLQVYL